MSFLVFKRLLSEKNTVEKYLFHGVDTYKWIMVGVGCFI